MAQYGVILQIVVGFCVLLVTYSKEGESSPSSKENEDSPLKPTQETKSKFASSSTTASNHQQILKESQIRNRRSNLENEQYYGDPNDSRLKSAFLYSDQIMQNLPKMHTFQPLSYARSNYYLNLLKPRETRFNSWDDHSLMHFGKRSTENTDGDIRLLAKRSVDESRAIKISEDNNGKGIQSDDHIDKKYDDAWHSMMSFGKKSDNLWDHNTLHFGKKDDPWHNTMSFGKKSDNSWDHSTLHFGKKDDPWHNMMSFGKKSDNPWDHSTLHFGKKDEPWHNIMSFGKRFEGWDHNTMHFGKRDEPWHNMMSFGKRDDPWHNMMSFGKKSDPWHSMMNFGKKSDPWHSTMSFGKKSDNPWDHTTLHFGKREEPWHNVMSFGKKSDHPWEHNTLHFGKKDDPWHNMMSFGKRFDNSWDHNTLHFGKRDEPWHNMMSFGKKSVNEFDDDGEMASFKKNDPWHSMMSFGKRSGENEENINKREDPWHTMLSFGKKSDSSWNNITNGYEKRDDPWHNMMSFGKKLDDTFGDHFTLHFGKRDQTNIIPGDRNNNDNIFLDKKDDPWHNMMSFGKKSENFGFDHNTMHFGKKNDPWHNMMSFGKRGDDPWDHTTLHFGKKDEPWHNLMSFGKKSDNPWYEHSTLHFGKREDPWHSTMSFGKKSEDLMNDGTLNDLRENSYIPEGSNELRYNKPVAWDNYIDKNSNDSFDSKASEIKSVDEINVKHLKKRSLDSWDNHNVMHFGKKSHPWDNSNTMHFEKKSDHWDNHNTLHFGKRYPWDYQNTVNLGKKGSSWDNYHTMHFGKKKDNWDNYHTMHFGKRSNFVKPTNEIEPSEDGNHKEDLGDIVPAGLVETSLIKKRSIKLHLNDVSKDNARINNKELNTKNNLIAAIVPTSRSFKYDKEEKILIPTNKASEIKVESAKNWDTQNVHIDSKEKSKTDESKDSDKINFNELTPKYSKFRRSLKSVDSLDDTSSGIHGKSSIDSSISMEDLQTIKQIETDKNLETRDHKAEANSKSGLKSRINKRSAEIDPTSNIKSALSDKDMNMDYFDENSKDVSREIALHFGKRSVTGVDESAEEVPNYPWLSEREEREQNEYWNSVVNGKRSYPWETQNVLHFGKRDPWDYHNTLHFGKKFDPWESHYKMHFGKRSNDLAYHVLHFGKRNLDDNKNTISAADDNDLFLSDEKFKGALEEKSLQELFNYLQYGILLNSYDEELDKEILHDLAILQSRMKDEHFYNKLDDIKQYLISMLMKLYSKQDSKEKGTTLHGESNEDGEDEQYYDDYSPGRFVEYAYMKNNVVNDNENVNDDEYIPDYKVENYETNLKAKRDFTGKELKRFWVPFQGPKSIVYPHAWFASQIRRSSSPRRGDLVRGMYVRMAEKKEDPFNSYMHFGKR